ncbi:MAG TPA: 23S rRNA (guanosine(2251)-2'-O)-methyltransferase RlmB [Nocardioidaceae bacterium]|nr:23S rRNA (guanosine(2251)-2'-O)-methyltransferase RlmB [Nocardioidaceae bacterium]
MAGRNALVEALRESVPVLRVYVAERLDHDDRVREVLKLAAVRRLPILEVPRPELDRLTEGAVHQGVAARLAPYDYADALEVVASARARGELPLLVALDSVTDPRNLGAVIRSAAAFGCHAVVVPERRAATMTAGAWKASAGAAARVPVARAANLTRELRGLQEAGLTIVGLDAAADSPIGDLDLTGEPLVLVVGSEGRGLSRLVRESCDVLAAIPMTAATESLNAGVAAGIALYEVARRRTP